MSSRSFLQMVNHFEVAIPNGCWILPIRSRWVTVIHIDAVGTIRPIYLRNLHPNPTVPSLVPLLNLITKLSGIVTIHKTNVLAIVLDPGIVNIRWLGKLHEDREIGQILALTAIIEGEFLSILPGRIPPARVCLNLTER